MRALFSALPWPLSSDEHHNELSVAHTPIVRFTVVDYWSLPLGTSPQSYTGQPTYLRAHRRVYQFHRRLGGNSGRASSRVGDCRRHSRSCGANDRADAEWLR